MQRSWTVTVLGEPISWEISEDSRKFSFEWFGKSKEMEIVTTREDWTYKFQKTQVKVRDVEDFASTLADDLFKCLVHAAMKKQLLG